MRSTDRRGFTLLELLIATFLSALILSVLYATFFAIRGTVSAVRSERKAYESGRVLLELIGKDIRGIKTMGNWGFVGQREEIERAGWSRLDFVTTSLLKQGMHSEAEVGYRVVKDEEGTLVLVRRESPVEGELTDGGNYFEVARNVKRFDAYFSDGGNWLDEWNSKAFGRVPKEVRVEIAIGTEDGEEKVFVVEKTIPSAL